MLKEFSGKVVIAVGFTDMRLGIDGLSSLVQNNFEIDPFNETLFLFCGRKKDRIKGLLWEKDGFLILTKRLEESKFEWPRTTNEAMELTSQQYRWLMEGLSIDQPKAHKNISGYSSIQ